MIMLEFIMAIVLNKKFDEGYYNLAYIWQLGQLDLAEKIA